MKPESAFPNSYRAGRAAFLEACRKSGLAVVSRKHPRAKGPDGDPLYLDTAVIGDPDATSAVLLISGTHGVEGYFGSGAQTALLRGGLAKRAKKGVKLVLLHALNPFGFAWNRRVNEQNADVNRNFVNHARPPANRDYDRLVDAISPRSIAQDEYSKANERLVAYAKAHGDFALQEAISAGQYRHPHGIYFGGPRESWSAKMLKDVFRRELKGTERLIAIDFHTGLGAPGAAEMITEDLPGSPAYKRAKALWGARVQSSEAGESLSPPLKGTLDKAVAKWMRGKELTFAALEVGTAPVREVFDALRKDNWLHEYASLRHRQAKAIKQQIRDAFYPDTASWKRKVWDHSADVVESAIEAIA